jgi:PadR family transcriptional regulator
MRLLSRKEEMLLLAIRALQDDDRAYGIAIRDHIETFTGIRWMFGAIYSPLGRLVNHGYVETYESAPIPEPGGRRKILYRLTPSGVRALLDQRRINAALWENLAAPAEEK